MSTIVSKTGRTQVHFREDICRKEFFATWDGWRSFWSERRAYRTFCSYPWMPQWIRWGMTMRGRPWFETERYSEDHRLDMVIESLADEAKREIAQQVLSIVLDLYTEGWAHRDLHARNLFLLDDGRVMLKDYETMTQYGASKPSFLSSYDITGRGLPSPYRTGNMGFFSNNQYLPSSVLGNALKVIPEDVPVLLAEILREEYRMASATFKKDGGRHRCRASLPYNSFRLAHLTIDAHEAQRDSQKRFAKIGLSRSDIEGKTIMDLGCHAGGMLFALQQFRPASSLGFEYDEEKVKTARRIAALEDLRSVEFRQADVDRLTLLELGGRKEVVLCLAIERHVRNPRRLFRLLGKACSGMLIFEGNAGSNPQQIEKELKANGFREVEYRGFCDDDILPDNNVRPLWVARK